MVTLLSPLFLVAGLLLKVGFLFLPHLYLWHYHVGQLCWAEFPGNRS